jgi:hypothetical protein
MTDTNEPNKKTGRKLIYRKPPISPFVNLTFDPFYHRQRFFARLGFWKKFHNPRVLIKFNKRSYIAVKPLSKPEPYAFEEIHSEISLKIVGGV